VFESGLNVDVKHITSFPGLVLPVISPLKTATVRPFVVSDPEIV
jgi:hypothetical protein